MREIFVHQDITRVGFYKSILDDAGIPNLIRNEFTYNTMAQLPSPLHFLPTLCVLHGEDYDRALRILGDFHYTPPCLAEDWNCAGCNETVPGNFDTCWQCGTLKEPPDKPDNPARI